MRWSDFGKIHPYPPSRAPKSRTQLLPIADGTPARRRPQPESLWADDLYMSVPALAQMGALTGDRTWFDEAVKQVLQTQV